MYIEYAHAHTHTHTYTCTQICEIIKASVNVRVIFTYNKYTVALTHKSKCTIIYIYIHKL